MTKKKNAKNSGNISEHVEKQHHTAKNSVQQAAGKQKNRQKNDKRRVNNQIKQVKEAPDVKKYARFCAILSFANMVLCMLLNGFLPGIQTWQRIFLSVILTLEFFILNQNVSKALQPRRVADVEAAIKRHVSRGGTRRAAFMRMIAFDIGIRLIPYAIVLCTVYLM